MTPKEKAKRYDEVLEELRGLLEGIHEEKCEIMEEDITSIFPELKESSDERVRKVLIDYFKKYKEQEECGIKTFYGIPADDILAWLEEQGEQKLNGTFVNVDDVREDFIDEVYRVLDADPTNDRVNQIIDAFDNLPTVTIKQDPCKHCKMTYSTCYSFPCDEKKAFEQGKAALKAINEEKVDNSNRVEPKDYNSIDPNFGKPTDKVEPKFHEGEWIVWQDKCYKVNYNGCGYELVDQNGLNTSLEYGTIDENAHLFNIQDAKDGDVLQLGKITAIFQDYISDKECRCYCSVFEGEFKIPIQYADTYGCHNAIPATKEQRDKLEKAMADAGYAFDFEKKELKKIDDEIEIPFGGKDSELQEATYYIPKGFHAEIDDDKVVIKKGEKPTTWSEKYIADVFEKVGLAKIVREQSNDALTIALQDAMIELSKTIPQPKQEWGEEDESMLFNVINRIEQLDHYWNKPTDEKLIDWLKSIKDRCTWKPSDKKMEVLANIFKLCKAL